MLQSRRDGMRQKAEAVVEFADKRIAHMDLAANASTWPTRIWDLGPAACRS